MLFTRFYLLEREIEEEKLESSLDLDLEMEMWLVEGFGGLIFMIRESLDSLL